MIRANAVTPHSAIAQVVATALTGLLFAAALQGCGTSKASSTACDSTQCAASNTCIAENDPVTNKPVTECRRLCSSQTDPMTGCPDNYTCVPDATGKTYCSANLTTYKQAMGQWGTPCNPSGGKEANPACDNVAPPAGGGFWCYGTGTTDGNAYCTQFDCTVDRDCAAGFYCGTVNSTPNVESNTRTVGATEKICIKRQYCAPCQTDLDCLPVNNLPSHCVADMNGANFCAPECSSDKACNTEAFCANVPGAPKTVCYPRANVCVGDGGLCAPCRSDGDCLKAGVQGACVRGEYATENFCAVPSPGGCTCKNVGEEASCMTTDIVSMCPTAGEVAKIPILCAQGTNFSDFKEIPKGYCVGLATLSQGNIETPGCYSKD